MKKYVRESFVKTFGIFFISLFILTTLLAFFYFKEQKHILEESIYTQMKAFTYDFSSKQFDVDIVSKDGHYDELNLQSCEGGMCGYFAIPSTPTGLFKVFLPQENFDKEFFAVKLKVIMLYSFIILAIFIFAVLYSFYALYPLKKALHLMEEFVKDMIHDLHTPVTSILLNTRIIQKHHCIAELEHIELGAKTIASLYHNLEILQKGFIPQNSTIELSHFLHVRALPFQKLYPKLHFDFELVPFTTLIDENALSRIVDNILSNACKYNTKNGTITLTNRNNTIIIKDSGQGIKNCDRVFERYYKESERGLGLGLNIVKTLCDALGIHISLESALKQGTTITLTLPAEKK